MSSRYSRPRALCLAAVYLLMGLHIAHWKLAGRTLAPLEFNEVLHTLHLGVVTAGFLFMAAAFLGTLVFGRFFCGWACHILALQDGSAWLLEKAGIRPVPLRSRVLPWVPPAAVLYLFVWPQAVRAYQGAPYPAWRVLGDAEGWASFVTTDYMRNLPGLEVTLLTFFICGFAVVYLLGSRGFCAAVCPYGTLFRAADAASPGRIVLAGDCVRCGLCDAGCASKVSVQDEVLRHGDVVDPRCLRDLDCVGVCPTGALRFGFTRPPLLRGLPAASRASRPYSFTPTEDAAIVLLSLGAFLALRGLYDAVPLLLALAWAVVLAVWWVLTARALRSSAPLTRAGRAAAAAGVLSAVLTLHSGFVRWHEARGAASNGRDALSHLETAHRWGLVRAVSLERRLAELRMRLGPQAEAEPHWRAVLSKEPRDSTALLGLGSLLASLGRLEEAETLLQGALEADPASAAARHNLELVRRLRSRSGR